MLLATALLIVGLLSWMMNEVNLSGLHDASWFAIVTPMSFGMPIFDPVSILTMTAVLIIVFIESMGMFLALGEIVGRKLSSHDIIRGLRVDGSRPWMWRQKTVGYRERCYHWYANIQQG